MSFLAFTVAFVVFLIIIVALPLKFRVTYRRLQQDDDLQVELAGFFGLWNYKVHIPMVDWSWAFPPHLNLSTVTKPSSGSKQQVKEQVKPGKVSVRVIGWFLGLTRRALRIRKWFYRGIHCKQFRWIMEVGFADAAYTGIAVGGLWGLMGYYIGKLHRNVTFEVAKPQLAVYPSFNHPQFRVDFDCIFSLRIGHIIIAGFKVLKLVKLVLRGNRA